MDRLIMTASNVSVSELKSNRKYLSVSMRMFSTRANLNKCAVTEGFIDDIIANKDDYVGMGLFADAPKMKNNDYKRGLTHLYDKKTGQFFADQIGSFYDLEKVEDEYGTSLIGYARIPKRSEAVCAAIKDLYENDSLNFSFEISAGAVEVVDGITIVDANENNELTGMAVVSVPAYPESKALDLVAEDETMEQLFAGIDMQISEVDIETVQRRFYEWLRESFGERIYDIRVLLFCVDCVILYDYKCGVAYKVEIIFNDAQMVIKDFYEVSFVRSEGSEEEMDVALNTVTVSEEVVEVAEVIEVTSEEIVAEEIAAEEVSSNEVQVAEEATEEPVQVAEEEVSAECNNEENKENAEEVTSEEGAEDNANSELEAMKKKCAELEVQIAELNEVKAQLEALRAEKQREEIEAKKNKLKAYAEREGLDLNNTVIAEAIEHCDYEAIVAEVTAKPVEEKNANYFASYADMSIKGGYSYLLERR